MYEINILEYKDHTIFKRKRSYNFCKALKKGKLKTFWLGF